VYRQIREMRARRARGGATPATCGLQAIGDVDDVSTHHEIHAPELRNALKNRKIQYFHD
jgi:hypothetical protein